MGLCEGGGIAGEIGESGVAGGVERGEWGGCSGPKQREIVEACCA